MFKKIILPILLISIMLGCSAKTETKPNKTIRTAEMQKNAEEAFNELDNDIKNNTDIIEDEEPKTEPTSPSSLYDEKKNPISLTDKAKPVAKSKFPIKDGYPVWVLNPTAIGYDLAAVGSASLNKNSLGNQKRVARMQAQAELSKMINVQVDNELSTSKSSDSNKTDMQLRSRQKANEYLAKIVTIDEWVNPTNKDYYVVIGIEK